MSFCDVIVGGQFGDEGKAKIIDSVASEYDVVVRYQGGSNAGHTVYAEGKKFIFHLVPSGLLYRDKIGVLGNGVVVNLKKLYEEINALEKEGISFDKRFFLSDRAFVVTSFHILLDSKRESCLEGRIGTTTQGIGPSYGDKIARMGIRVGDLKNKDRVKKILERNLREKNALLTELYKEKPIEVSDVLEELYAYYDKVKQFVVDSAYFLNEKLSEGKNVLFEGAQGVGLDIDFGTYPYVTCSSSSVAGVLPGTGVNVFKLRHIIGIFKAYCTRVGEGPFPTRLTGEEAENLRRLGAEYGSTTGRPRECGWFDVVHSRYAVMVSSINQMALTKLDVFDTYDTVKVCVGYKIEDKIWEHYPSSLFDLEKATPIYEELVGWKESTEGITDIKKLPPNALKYVSFLEKRVGVPIRYLSTGREREAMIRR